RAALDWPIAVFRDQAFQDRKRFLDHLGRRGAADRDHVGERERPSRHGNRRVGRRKILQVGGSHRERLQQSTAKVLGVWSNSGKVIADADSDRRRFKRKKLRPFHWRVAYDAAVHNVQRTLPLDAKKLLGEKLSDPVEDPTLPPEITGGVTVILRGETVRVRIPQIPRLENEISDQSLPEILIRIIVSGLELQDLGEVVQYAEGRRDIAEVIRR